jgi:hypothetical protein
VPGAEQQQDISENMCESTSEQDSSEEQFSCLYLLAAAAVSELERQRTTSPATFAANSQTVPFKKRNHLRPDSEQSKTVAAN